MYPAQFQIHWIHISHLSRLLTEHIERIARKSRSSSILLPTCNTVIFAEGEGLRESVRRYAVKGV